MDISLKQRLLGASVLVAVTVIFLPLLFDGAGQRAKRELDIQIPPPPPVPVSRLNIPQPPLEALESLPEAVKIPAKPNQQQPPAVPQVAKAPVVKVQPNKADLRSWVLQVGSYRERGNARDARDKLKKSADYHAFIQEAQSGSGRIYRVRIGPMSSRAKADALRQRLQKKEGVQAIVLRHH